MADPTLFDHLRDVNRKGRRIGDTVDPDRSRLAQMERDWLDQTVDIGILADLSTVEFACRTLIVLWREHKTLTAAYLDAIDRVSRSQPSTQVVGTVETQDRETPTIKGAA